LKFGFQRVPKLSVGCEKAVEKVDELGRFAEGIKMTREKNAKV